MNLEDNSAINSGPEPTPPVLLFVDDESSILKALQRLFRPHGYHILTAESGIAGLEIMTSHRVDLVISDMRMPEMDGARFLEQVRSRYPEVIRIILTGYADINSIVAAVNQGEIYRFITKPWEEHSILLIVRDALERRRLEKDNARLVELTRRQNEELKALNDGLERRVQERTQQLAQANHHLRQNFLLSIKIFSTLMELREGTVGGHARRVAGLAKKLAIRMNLNEEAQQDIVVAAMLHDIGKIGFSDALFSRSLTRMSVSEMERYHRHSIDGSSALMPLTELYPVAAIIRSHHERYDGRGFPDGLVGEDIPMGARILAVCNDYDCLQYAINTDKKMDPEQARETMIQTRGQRYDPQVLEAFLTLVVGQPGEELGQDLLVPVEKLEIGMVLARDLLSHNGTILLAENFTLDARLINSIKLYANREGLPIVLHIRPESASTE